jgi:hypothetical protein
MTSGKPLTKTEMRVIEEMHETTFPAVIANHLASKYYEENGGSRSASTVRAYIRQLTTPKPAPERRQRKPK